MKPDRYDVLCGVLIGGVWGAIEWTVTDPLVRYSVRWAIPVGIGASPAVFWMYSWGLEGGMTDTLKAVGLNFAYKALVLAGTPFLVGSFTTLNYVIYEFLLFFVLFSLSFLAIYHARNRVK